MKVLLTNDDGIQATGLHAMRRALLEIPGIELAVIAPDSNRSATARSITTRRPLWVEEVEFGDGTSGYATDGTPVDCVRFATLGLIEFQPELIVSGINHGSNLGDDITYSGTVAAALEGIVLGIPAIAVSLAFLGYFDHGFDLVASGINYGANLGDDITYSGTVSAAMEAVINGCPAFAISQEYYEHPDFALAALAAATVAKNLLEHGLSRGELLNVNVPAVTPEECEGFEVTRLGRRVYQDQLLRRVDPRGIPYYWIGGPPPSGLAVPGTDFHAVVHRRVAVTPIHLDLTGRSLLKRLRTWSWPLDEVAAPDVAPDEPAGEAEEGRIAEEQAGERR